MCAQLEPLRTSTKHTAFTSHQDVQQTKRVESQEKSQPCFQDSSQQESKELFVGVLPCVVCGQSGGVGHRDL